MTLRGGIACGNRVPLPGRLAETASSRRPHRAGGSKNDEGDQSSMSVPTTASSALKSMSIERRSLVSTDAS